MKQLILIVRNPSNFKMYRRTFLAFLLFLLFGAMLLLPSFSRPQLTSSSLILPFSKPISFEPTSINCRINNVIANGYTAKEASFFNMEQAEGVYANVLQMILNDGKGNLLALSLSDLEKVEKDSCLTTSFFYGMEHEKNSENFSRDIGSTVFANHSSLIYENGKGESVISRNGWIKINRCEMGMISGYFYFKLERETSTEFMEGEFVNVMLEFE